MELYYIFASRLLMKPIDILGYDRLKLSFFLKLAQGVVGGVGHCILIYHPVFIKSVEFLGISDKEAPAYYHLRGILVFHVIKSVFGTEIGYTAFGGDSRTSEKDYIFAFFY